MNDLLAKLAAVEDDSIIECPDVCMPADCWDGIAGKTLLWLIEQHPEADLVDLHNVLITAQWWLILFGGQYAARQQLAEKHKAATSAPPAPDERVTCPACGGSRHIVESVHLAEPIECFVCEDGRVTQQEAERWLKEEVEHEKGQEP